MPIAVFSQAKHIFSQNAFWLGSVWETFVFRIRKQIMLVDSALVKPNVVVSIKIHNC